MLRAIVVTALELEFRAVRGHLVECRDVTHRTGAVYTIGSLTNAERPCHVCLIQTGAGNDAAAVDTSNAIGYFQPDVIVFVGIAGGLKDVNLGDVVAATAVWNYERAKVRETVLEPRVDGAPCSYALIGRARAVSRNDRWKNGLQPEPHSHLGPIVAGDKVVAGRDSQTIRAIRQMYGDALAIEMEGRGLLQAALTHKVDVIDIRGISDMASADKSETDAAGYQELAARNAAAFAAELLSTHEIAPEGSGPAPVEPALPDTPDFFPPAAARELEGLRKRDPELYRRLIDAFTRRDVDLRSVLRDLVARPPDWLQAQEEAWIVIGYCAVAQTAWAVAAEAFEQAVRAGAQPSSHWLAQAAVNWLGAGEQDRGEKLLRDAASGAPDDRFVQAIAASVRKDHKAILALGGNREGMTEEEQLTLDGLQAAAYLELDERDQALQAYESLRAKHSDRALVAVQLANLLINRAEEGRSPDRQADLDRARSLAVVARDLLRRRRGDSSVAVRAACQSAIAQGDGRTALDLALPEPEGEATLIESTSPPVARAAVEAAFLIQDRKLAERLARRIEEPYWRALFEGSLAAQEPAGKEAALKSFERALQLASDDRQRFFALMRIADLGVWPLPIDPSKLPDLTPLEVDIVLARSEVARDRHDEAKARLRTWKDSSLVALEQLSSIYVSSGDIEGAIDLLRSGAERHQAPELLVHACDLAMRAGHWAETVQISREVLSLLSDSSRAASHVRRRLIEAGGRQGNWKLVEEYARLELRHNPGSIPLRWALLVATFNRTQREEAWRVLNEVPELEPQDEYQARIKITLLSRFETTAEGVKRILELADRFRESELVVATALRCIYTMRPQMELPATVLARLHSQTTDFFERFPESEILRRVDVGDPERFVENISQQIAIESGQLREVVRRVGVGEVPYGVLASASNKLYAITLAIRAGGPLLGVPNALALMEADLLDARTALNKTVLVESSALSVLAGITSFWDVVAKSFHRLVASDLAVYDAVASRDEASLRPTLGLGLDSETGKVRAFEISEQDAQILASQTEWMAATMLTLEQEACRQLPHFPEEPIHRFGAWASALELAVQKGYPLYSDDLVLRMFTRQLGGHAFGTFAIARVLNEMGRIGKEQLNAVEDALMLQLVVDLPDAYDRIERLAAEAGWRPGPATVAAARPALWSEPARGIQFFTRIFERVFNESREQLANWVYAAMISGSFLKSVAAGPFIAQLLLTAITSSNSSTDLVPELVTAARRAAQRLGSADPLPLAARQLISVAETTMPAAAAAQYTIGVFEQLDEADRLIVMRIVSAPDQRERAETNRTGA